jgi:starch phosphorylase
MSDGNGRVQFAGSPNASFERHLEFDRVLEARAAGPREQFEALARSLRDLLAPRWLETCRSHDQLNPKQVYYLSMEFLIGRSLGNNVVNLRAEPLLSEAMRDKPLDWAALVEAEPDAGLGNGGLGRLAACFMDSLATHQIPATGYGMRYEYGMFCQEIVDGYQVERPDNWLRGGDPWEVARPAEAVEVRLNASVQVHDGRLVVEPGRPTTLLGIPYDRPLVGYGGKTINTLRLWAASSPDYFDLAEFERGDFFGAVHDRVAAESLTKVLYPDDSTVQGRGLRFVQEYFLAACSLADLLARFRRRGNDWDALPEKVAVQLNDTHPAIAVAELMRLLLDGEKLCWDRAWDLTLRTLAYTNHTLLPEALEKWPVRLFETLLPRHLEIIDEINLRFLDDVRRRFPGDDGRVRRVSLFEEGVEKKVRMAHLAVVGCHSTNGVSEIHSRLLAERILGDFVEMYPERFHSETNGVTPRRFLLQSNPELAGLITCAIGDGWVTDLEQLRKIVPLAEDSGFRAGFRKAARDAKVRFSNWAAAALGRKIDPDTIFDSQIKRIHEYKRQLLNVLHVVMLYNRLRDDPHLPESQVPRRTFFFAGKAAPAYAFAKLLIKLIHNVGAVLDADPVSRDRLKVVFLPDYSVTLAERLIPASDVSEQISTAGYEASGTSNMKFMMNGALTVGTRDGATVEMAREAGEENIFLFGLTAEQVQHSRSWYSPWWHYHNEPAVRAAVDLLLSDHFCRGEPGLFDPVRRRLLDEGDVYMHLADLTSYAQAQQRVGTLYADPEEWARVAVINVGRSGKFSSDRTVCRYARDIWGVGTCAVG